MVRPAPRAQLFSAVTVADQTLFGPTLERLARRYTKVAEVLPPFRFSEISDYYRDEMGDDLWKTFVLFDGSISLDGVAGYKRASSDIERTLADADGRRQVNIDPGYLTLFNFCLLTTKGYSHRVYLEQGIWAEVTLIVEAGRLRALPWTYPDYRSERARSFLEQGRQRLKAAIAADEQDRRR